MANGKATKPYKVLVSFINVNDRKYERGSIVELTDAQAAPFLKSQYISPVKVKPNAE